VLSSLSNDKAVEDIFNLIVPILSKKSNSGTKAIYVDVSTVLPSTISRLASEAEQKGVIFFSSPVFGRPEASQNAQLVSIPSGPKDAVERVRPFLASYSRAVVNLGENPGVANSMKLSGNFMIAAVIDLLGQSMTFAEKNSVSRESFLQVVQLLFPSTVFTTYANRLANDDFDVPPTGGFTTTLGLKDVNHIRTVAQQSNCPLPFADIIYQHINSLIQGGNEDLDWTALAAINRVAAGLPLRKEEKK